MATPLQHGQTHTGVVHLVRKMTTPGGRELLNPICRNYNLWDLHYVNPVEEPLTCKRCIAREEKSKLFNDRRQS
jgi:hypothetical protein